jgi:hypothetical protein
VPKNQYFGMCGRIGIALPAIHGFCHHSAVTNKNGTHRHLAPIRSRFGLGQCLPHDRFVVVA